MPKTLFLVLAVAIAVAALGMFTLGRTLRHPGALAEMRGTVATLRAAADSCRAGFDEQQAQLLAYNERLQTMRERVRDLEGLHPRGVPADSYGVYIELFQSYNDSAGQWEARVAAVRAELETCRGKADAHNVALDSLRVLIRER
jgi:hypothetical protein